MRFTALLTTASENLGAGHKVSRGLATTLFFLFPAHTRAPRSLSRRPKRLAPSPSSRPGVQTPSPSSPDPGVQAPSPSSRPGGPDPQPLLQMLLQTPSPSSRPGVQIPLFRPQTRGSRLPVPSPDPRVQPPGPSSLRPRGPDPQPLPAQTRGSSPSALPGSDAGMSPASNTHTVCSLVAQWMGICLPMQGTQVPPLVPTDPTCCRGQNPRVRHNS